MTNLAFVATTIVIWIAILTAYSLLAPTRDQDPDSEFDMTIEMSKSCGLSILLVTIGITAVAIAFMVFAYADWI